MLKQAALTALALSVGLASNDSLGAQSRAAKNQTLTARDYVEIKQLVVRSAYAMDTGGGPGYADLFTADGEHVNPAAKGREQLAALASGGARGPALVRQYLMNYLIEPSPEGARGKQYVIEIEINDDPPSRHLNGRSEWEMVGVKGGELSARGGHYDDIYVKTPQGWRFKRREFIQSTTGTATTPTFVPSAPPVVAPTARTSPPDVKASNPIAGNRSLTPMDYIEIEQLVANYGYALDTGANNGYAYADNFAKDGVVFGRITWREPMAELQRKQVFGPKFVRHFLTNMLIEPTADGAKGKNYLVVLDFGEGGAPSSIYIGGHYEDTYEKTAEGWRFKSRTLIYSKTGPPTSPAQ